MAQLNPISNRLRRNPEKLCGPSNAQKVLRRGRKGFKDCVSSQPYSPSDRSPFPWRFATRVFKPIPSRKPRSTNAHALSRLLRRNDRVSPLTAPRSPYCPPKRRPKSQTEARTNGRLAQLPKTLEQRQKRSPFHHRCSVQA